MGLTRVDNRQIATIVTHLEMRERPRPVPMPAAPFRLVPWKQPSLDAYRTLFQRVGASWLWFSRLVIPDATLSAIINDPQVAIYAVTDLAGIEVGLLELDFRRLPDCELAYFGLVPDIIGKGVGRWLMTQALALAWRKDVTRLWVHTCTLDSPSALAFYIRSGFTPFAREVETFDDPRLLGYLPRETAPQVPILA